MSSSPNNNDTFRVLLLEDDRISQLSSSRAVLQAAPESVILLAPSLAEGRRLLADSMPQVCVLDIQLPDGSGLDFLHDVQAHAPAACVVILTGVPLPHHRDQAEAFGVLHFMEKPADSRSLGPLIREEWEKWRASRSGSGGGFSAMLTQLSTLDLIQLKCLGRATVTLEFTGDHGRQGRIHFKDGEIVHAERGEASGVEAFNEIVGWRGGRVVEAVGSPTAARTIEGNWQSLLMHAVQWVDEQKQG